MNFRISLLVLGILSCICTKDGWCLYIESYPVYVAGKSKPQRVREYINRIVTTPVWDKSRTARTTADGSTTYKPERDENGIIQCKSPKDQESCVYADKVRGIRQHEYDSAALYTDVEAAQAEQNEKSQCNFIEYLTNVSLI